MKRLFVCLMSGLALVQAAHGTVSTYTTPVVSPPQTKPVVDATNFVMSGTFKITTSALYDFSNVENYTNRGTIDITPGVWFDTSPSSAGVRHPARNFVNANNVNTNFNNTRVYGSSQVLVDATNVINRGSLASMETGLVRVHGDTVDMSRGTVEMGTAGLGGALENTHWGFSSAFFDPVANLNPAFPLVPAHLALSPNGGSNNDFSFAVAGNGGLLQEFTDFNSGPTNVEIQFVFVRTSDPSLPVSVWTQNASATRPGVVTIEWNLTVTNVLGKVVTTYLTLMDTYGAVTTNLFFTNFFDSPVTLTPENFTVTIGTNSLLRGVPMNNYNTAYSPDNFGTNATPQPLSNNVADFGVLLLPTAADPSSGSPLLSFADNVRHLPGRVEISGDKTLDMNLARVQGQSYVLVSGTNHFAGSSNALISTLYGDMRLSSTNGFLNATSLIQPTVRRLSGSLDIYSGVWGSDLLLGGGGTNPGRGVYNVIYVDANLSQSIPSQLLDLILKSKSGTNRGAVVIGDSFTPIGTMNVDASALTVASGAGIDLRGFESADDGDWAHNVPYLLSLTNLGIIRGTNAFSFLQPGQAADGSDLPYVNFVNSGGITNGGNNIFANYVENSGGIRSLDSDINIQAGTVNIPFPGYYFAGESSINLTCFNLNIANAGQFLFPSLWPGRALSLIVSNTATVGSNFWSVGDGINLYVAPTTGDFNLVTVTNTAAPFENVNNVWAGQDRGLSAAGFVNNGALGRLILDGGDSSAFTFSDLQDGDAVINALYVDVLVLRNSASNMVGGLLANVYVQPEMRIYYSHLYFNNTEVTGTVGGASGGGGFQQLTHAGSINTAAVPGAGGSGVAQSDVGLKVSVDNPPLVHLSWNTFAGAMNYVYYKTSSTGPWVLLTSFNSPATGPTSIDDNAGGQQRWYRVRVDLPTQ